MCVQDLRLLEEYFNNGSQSGFTIQKYGKVKNKRQLNNVTYSAVQRFSKYFRSVGKHKGFAFYLTDANV